MSSPSGDSTVRHLGQYRIDPKELEKFGSLDGGPTTGLGSVECSWDCLPLSKSHTQDNPTFHGGAAGFGFDNGTPGTFHSTQLMSSSGQWNPLGSAVGQSLQSQGTTERFPNVSRVHEKPVIGSQTSCMFDPGQYTARPLEGGLPVHCMVPSFSTVDAPKVSNLNVQSMGLTNPEYVALPTHLSHPFGGSVLLSGRNGQPYLGSYVGTDQTVAGPVTRVQHGPLHMDEEPANQPPYQHWGKFTPTYAAITKSVSGVSHVHKEINSSDSEKQKNCHQTDSVEMGRDISKLVEDLASGYGEEKWIAKFGKSSPYIGVTKHRKSNRWEAHIWIKDYGRQLYLGGFSTAEEAACAYDLVAIKCKGVKATTNFRSDRYSPLMSWLSRVSLPEILSHVRRRSKGFSRGNSMYRGVTQHPNGRWESRIGISGNRHIYLGLYEKQEDAASHYDRALVRMRGWRATTNFPFSEYQSELDEHKRLEEKLMDDAEEIECESDPILRKVYGLWVKKGGRDPLERLIVRLRESEETKADSV